MNLNAYLRFEEIILDVDVEAHVGKGNVDRKMEEQAENMLKRVKMHENTDEFKEQERSLTAQFNVESDNHKLRVLE